MHYLKLIHFYVGFLYLFPAQAQTDDWQDFQKQARAVGTELSIPVENQYKKVKGKSSLYQCDYAVKKRKGDLEIRFVLIPADSMSIPHIETMSLITLLATNEQETVVSLLQIEQQILQEEYHADWGIQAFFTPKTSFSKKQHCKLLALYKEEKAMAYLLYLFDEPNEHLDQQQFILRFGE